MISEIIVRLLTSNPFLPLKKEYGDSGIVVDYNKVEYLSMQEDKRNIGKDFQNVGKDMRKDFEEYSHK